MREFTFDQDTANIDLLVIVSLESDITLLTPGSRPGVLDQPILFVSLDTVSDKKDTVIKLSLASWIIENTRVVGKDLVSLDTDGDWVSQNGSLEGSSGVLLDTLPSTDDLLGLNLLLTSSISGGVWISSFGWDTVLLDPSQSVGHLTTVTSVVTVLGAVNQILLGESGQSTSSELVSTFNGTGSGESPTGSAVSLVLNWGNSSLSSPIPTGWGRGLGKFNLSNWSSAVAHSSVTEVLGLNFLQKHVGESVQSNGVTWVLVHLNLEVVLEENTHSEDFLVWRSVHFVVLDSPGFEDLDDSGWNWALFELVSVQLVVGSSCQQDSSGDENSFIQIHFYKI
jgi:hypothetical protein